MAYTVMAGTFGAIKLPMTIQASTVMAYVVMANIVMAYIDYGLHRLCHRPIGDYSFSAAWSVPA